MDGNPSDIVGPSAVPPLVLEDERVGQAQGRRRGQIRISDRMRQFDEEDHDYDTRMQSVAVDFEGELASEHRLFTLTTRHVQKTETGVAVFPAVIKMDDISSPDDPVPIDQFILQSWSAAV